MKHNSLSDWLGWLEKSHPKEIDLGLERIHTVAARMNLLRPAAKIITIAGTNGKGSCATACAALLQKSGARVGLYTSPHLLHYNERIQLNGHPVSEQAICDAFEKIFQAAGEISLTYFEYGTLAALQIFHAEQVDFWVLEVGLGGRLDAVNILDADLAIITSIALDHEAWLGDTREKIAIEKAGIMRSSQNFICADENPPRVLLDRACALNTRAYFLHRDFDFEVIDKKSEPLWQWQGKNSQGQKIHTQFSAAPQLPLPSMAAAIQALELLDVHLSWEQITETLKTLRVSGRFQTIIHNQRKFILDVAHNPAATAFLAKRIESEIQHDSPKKVHALVAMMADKDCRQTIANLTRWVDDWYLLELNDNPRAASTEQLESILQKLNQPIIAQGPIQKVLPKILSDSNSDDLILVFGSFFTVADVLHCFEKVE